MSLEGPLKSMPQYAPGPRQAHAERTEPIICAPGGPFVLDEYPPLKNYAAEKDLSLRVQDLREAIRLTADGGDRNRDYGDPVENHQKIADIFGAITGKTLTAREVAFVLLSVKLARMQTAPGKGDSYVDAMAYLGIAHECAEAEAKA